MSEEKKFVYRHFQTREAAEDFLKRFKLLDFDWSTWPLVIKDIEEIDETHRDNDEGFCVGIYALLHNQELVETGLHDDFDAKQPLTFEEFDNHWRDYEENQVKYKGYRASRHVITFGKYIGKPLGDIPISYLDGTVSAMPNQWIVRQAIAVVDAAMLTNGKGSTLNEKLDSLR
jgi:hypothetical protein